MEAKCRAEQIYADSHKCSVVDGVYDAKVYQSWLKDVYMEISSKHFAQIFPAPPISKGGGMVDWDSDLSAMQSDVLKILIF